MREHVVKHKLRSGASPASVVGHARLITLAFGIRRRDAVAFETCAEQQRRWNCFQHAINRLCDWSCHLPRFRENYIWLEMREVTRGGYKFLHFLAVVASHFVSNFKLHIEIHFPMDDH
jgi:hypothetical protein